MRTSTRRSRGTEIRQALSRCRGELAAAGVFSFFVNLLMLTGPLFMLQVYDRVLGSRSEATLVALLILISGLFAFMGALDFIRSRVFARAGARFESLLDTRVFRAVLRRSLTPGERALPSTAPRDLEAVRQVLAGPAPAAVFDLPWTPVFLGVVFIFHPFLGWIALGGALLMITLTILNQVRSREPNVEAQVSQNMADMLGEALRQNAETVRGLGMRETGLRRWSELRARALAHQIVASDRTASYANATKTLRLYLQSLLLAAGAWLVLRNEVTPGVMIASSIIVGRALAPVEQAIGQWSLLQRARRGWSALVELLEATPAEPVRTRLPAPRGMLEAQDLAAAAPGERKPGVAGVSFRLEPGQALGVIGPSGSGKSTLAKALTGVWPAVQGVVRIDGASLTQWPEDEIGRHVGYLPQEVSLFAGTVAQNIARLSSKPDSAKVVEAAQRAGTHEVLLELPQGYDTEIGANGQRLSGGQRQRVALARALYDDPAVLVLDEPNASLDPQGEQALVWSIHSAKARGRTIVVMAHRPAAIAACDFLLVIDKGRQVDFGPRDEVLRRRLKSYTQSGAGQDAEADGPAPKRHERAPAAMGAPAMGVVRPLAATTEHSRPGAAQLPAGA